MKERREGTKENTQKDNVGKQRKKEREESMEEKKGDEDEMENGGNGR